MRELLRTRDIAQGSLQSISTEKIFGGYGNVDWRPSPDIFLSVEQAWSLRKVRRTCERKDVYVTAYLFFYWEVRTIDCLIDPPPF